MLEKEYDIYLPIKNQELNIVTDPVSRSILATIQEKPSTLVTLSETLNIPQTTVVNKLTQLEENGLIVRYTDPQSKKLFYRPMSLFFASNSKFNLEEGLYLPIAFQELADARGDFEKSYLGAVLIGIQAAGMDISPWMKWIGYNVGLRLAEDANIDKIEDFIGYLKQYFAVNDMGTLELETFLPLTFTFKDSMSIPGFSGSVKAHYCAGLLKASISKIMSRNYEIERVKIKGEEKDQYLITLEEGENIPNCLDIELFFE